MGKSRFAALVKQYAADPGKDIAVRAAKTYVQTFFGVVTADAAGILHTSTLKTAAVAGLGGVASVLQNALK